MILDFPRRVIQTRARAMKRSESYIKHRFKEEMGQTPADHVLRRKVDLAKERLFASEATITQIAMHFGFSTSQHFATAFRRYVGLSPLAYRRSRR